MGLDGVGKQAFNSSTRRVRAIVAGGRSAAKTSGNQQLVIAPRRGGIALSGTLAGC